VYRTSTKLGVLDGANLMRLQSKITFWLRAVFRKINIKVRDGVEQKEFQLSYDLKLPDKRVAQ
jgi:hypothetical protein